jgi:rubrerythrin
MKEKLPERVEKLFKVFKMAVEEERKAQVMYRDAIALCQNEVTRVVLQGLLDDEVRHEREIIERYNALRRQHNLEDH